MLPGKEKPDRAIPRIGVALSSGGVRGVFAHTGFLLSLQQMDIPISAITGCSAGAVVGGVFASGKNIQAWADTLLAIKPQEFWVPSWSGLFWSLLTHHGKGYTGISPTKPAMDFCIEQLQVKTFEQCKIPFYALAKNLATGEKKIFSQGELAPRIVASAAIPLLYQPVEINNEYYCDGALLDLAPTDAICCKHHLDILIIHHVAQRNQGQAGLQQIMHRPWSLVSILNLLLFQQRPWYLSAKPLTFRRCPCGCDAIIIVMEPCLPEFSWPVTENAYEVMEAANQQTKMLLKNYVQAIKQDTPALKKLIENDAQITSFSNTGWCRNDISK